MLLALAISGSIPCPGLLQRTLIRSYSHSRIFPLQLLSLGRSKSEVISLKALEPWLSALRGSVWEEWLTARASYQAVEWNRFRGTLPP